jgi:hypothetical protein
MARATGAAFSGGGTSGTLTIAFFGRAVPLAWPELEPVDEPPLPDHVLALLVYHLARSDGTAPAGTPVSFADLPDGRFYVQAFRGYTAHVIARRFGPSPGDLSDALATVGARPAPGLGDRAWIVPALPRVPLTLVWWDADEEFGARAEILFDAAAPHHLTIDGCAVLGSWLTTLLTRA